MRHASAALIVIAGLAGATSAAAQRVDENVAATAGDAFGAGVGNERVGIYSGGDVRGFSPIAAGNIRLEGLYIDRVADFSERLVGGDTVRVGITAQNYLFASPTGVDDVSLRPAGKQAVLSAAAVAMENGNRRIDLDGQLPLSDTLSLAGGAGYFHRVLTSGGTGNFASFALRARWAPARGVEISPFWGRMDTIDRQASPTFVTSSAFIPKNLVNGPGRYIGPEWSGQRIIALNYGVIAKADTGGWRLWSGLFRSTADTPENYAFLLRNLTPDGQADRLIFADPPLKTDSFSGELRLDRRLREGGRQHTFSLSMRGRHREATYGGGVAIDYGRADVNAPLKPLPPSLAFGPVIDETVEQWTPGAGYELRWRDKGSLNLGLQRAIYSKTVRRPDGSRFTGDDRSWLYNVNAAYNLTPRIAVYVGAATGLEESGVAPDSAVNRRQILPAIHTAQIDGGVRVILPRARVVVGLFDIRKPYFAADAQNLFVEAGDIRHRGLEFSVTSSPIPGLTLIGGGVLMQPQVSGLSVERGVIGPKPVGDVKHVATLSASYAPPAAPQWIFNASAYYHSDRTASSSNQSATPPAGFVDASVRYRLKLKDRPAVLKLQATNITNTLDYAVFSNNTFGFNVRRLISLSLAVDI